MTPAWWSQPFPPEGSVASDGVKKQLGAPSLDPLVILLREMSQNSWDARRGEGQVRLEYRFETLGADRANAFSAMLLPGPAGDDFGLTDTLQPGRHLLVVSDRGTTGLGGPLRSDEPADGRSPDFVNFLRNVGEARDNHLGGGTYGFGKGILYRVSAAATILVDTMCIDDGRPQRRLMGAALGPTFVAGGRRQTGRHWWGAVNDSLPDPLLDGDAYDVAGALGLVGFGPGETGTDIYVFGPLLGEFENGSSRSVLEAAELIAGTAAWHLWPKLIDRPTPSISMTVRVDDEEVRVPDPAHAARIRPFVRAMRKLDANEGLPLRRTIAPRDVGDFAIETDVILPRVDRIVDIAAPFDGPPHHCARMRSVELVVDYVPGPPPGDSALQYGAVFRATAVADEHFAAAEPPTHDNWVTTHLTGTDHGVVAKAKRWIAEQMAAAVEPASPATSTSGSPLGQLSSSLAKILPGTAGDGGAIGGGGSGGGGAIAAKVKASGQPRLALINGEALVVQGVVFQPSSGSLAAVIVAAIASEGGTERTAPTGGEQPVVLGWSDGNGSWVNGDRLAVGRDDAREWTVHIRPAPNTATAVSVRSAEAS